MDVIQVPLQPKASCCLHVLCIYMDVAWAECGQLGKVPVDFTMTCNEEQTSNSLLMLRQ